MEHRQLVTGMGWRTGSWAAQEVWLARLVGVFLVIWLKTRTGGMVTLLMGSVVAWQDFVVN